MVSFGAAEFILSKYCQHLVIMSCPLLSALTCERWTVSLDGMQEIKLPKKFNF